LRWVIHRSACDAESTTSDKAFLVAALTEAGVTDKNPVMRDVWLHWYATQNSISCSGINNRENRGAKVNVDVDGTPRCFENVHPDTWDVYDASAWAVYHPGNRPRLNYGRSNPITDFAARGEAPLHIYIQCML